DVAILPALSPVIGATVEDAEAKYKEIKNLIGIEEALNYLGRYFDHFDFSQFPLDEPFPDIGDVGKNSFQSTTDEIKAMAKKENLTLREVALSVATPKSEFFGTYEQVADKMIEWVDNEAADGFVISMYVMGKQYDDFLTFVVQILEDIVYFNCTYESNTFHCIDKQYEDFLTIVVQILEEKGYFNRNYESDTLRGNLDLPFIENRYRKQADYN